MMPLKMERAEKPALRDLVKALDRKVYPGTKFVVKQRKIIVASGTFDSPGNLNGFENHKVTTQHYNGLRERFEFNIEQD